MKTIIKLKLILLSLLFTVNGFSQKKIDISNQIDSLLQKEYQDKRFNGNVLVVKENKTLYEKSFGYLEPIQKEKLTKDFKFQIGSIYKEFVAVAIMQLYEKGLIDLENDVNRYVSGNLTNT
jgi:CubicO group peptidase (beta-lactamase class C family)